MRLAWADFLSRSDELNARQHAVELFPSATLYNRLAEKREELGGNPIPDLEQAAALEPDNPEPRLRLGLSAELAGDFVMAERSLLQAGFLSRHYQPRYLLAQYYFRRQNADSFWRWSHEAFEAAYGDIVPLLDLCWRMRPDAERLAQQAPSLHPEIAGQFLLFLAGKHQTRGARALALRLAGAARSEDLPLLLAYCDSCLREGDGTAATEVWNALCVRHLLKDRVLDPAGGVSLTNGAFEHPPTGKGLDWRMEQNEWLRFAGFHGGVRLTFSGSQPERCLIAWQYAPVEPGVRYRLRLAPVAGPPPAEGLGWSVETFSGKPVATERNPDYSMTFTPETEVVRLGLIYQRPLGSTRLAGTITVAGVRLERER